MSRVSLEPEARGRTRKSLPVERREAWRLFEAAAVLGVSESMLKVMLREGAFPAPVKIRSRNMWRAAEVRAWLAAGAPNIRHWVWRPAQVQHLQELIRAEREEYAELSAIVEKLRRERAQLESMRQDEPLRVE